MEHLIADFRLVALSAKDRRMVALPAAEFRSYIALSVAMALAIISPVSFLAWASA